jgi:hypothetical protein
MVVCWVVARAIFDTFCWRLPHRAACCVPVEVGASLLCGHVSCSSASLLGEPVSMQGGPAAPLLGLACR